MADPSLTPCIVVTGANSGVGFGICHRLLVQMSSKCPQDGQFQYPFHSTRGQVESLEQPDTSCGGPTLVLACRDLQRGEAARTGLYKLFDQHLHNLRKHRKYDGHADTFRLNLKIQVLVVDLGSIESIFQFRDELSQRYPYVSHLILNAGMLSVLKYDEALAMKQMRANFVEAVTAPNYYIQNVGELSSDGLGKIWQTNVFGHYVLFRLLEPMLENYKASSGARVIWMSSHEANARNYNPTDWQLLETHHPYESSKYQVDMISLQLDRRALQRCERADVAVRHFTVLPGIVQTNMTSGLATRSSKVITNVLFHIARWLGSPYHPFTTYKAAISAVHACLVPMHAVPIPESFAAEESADYSRQKDCGLRYTSETDRRGRTQVGFMKLKQSRKEEVETDTLLDTFDLLLKSFQPSEAKG
ncbi:NAD(P)-binding protein [Leucogyrophana mollusca]|uniref:NAD(P)-binding protein n=1 Tax=Leucogyrophana mollusca TaxID=85980 RepID=A0ACB8AWS8_9AGAM|nr:NAD(P)-binding protein [Leucogyrophana mollusca]